MYTENDGRFNGIIFRHVRQMLSFSQVKSGITDGSHKDAVIEDAALVTEKDRIAWLGKDSDLPQQYLDQEDGYLQMDASGHVLMPGLVDCHTHLVFGGFREQEFQMRVEGKSYQEIAQAGGGILSTVEATRGSGKEELVNKALLFLDRMMELGVTTVEIKSGYGLDWATENKMLEVIAALSQLHTLKVVPTFLVHTVPKEMSNKRAVYLEMVKEQFLPQVMESNLAQICDIFCDQIAFSAAESQDILLRAQELGFKIKVHAEQLTNSGGSLLAAKFKALSADHLEMIDQQGIEALAEAGTTAVVLPGCNLFLNQEFKTPVKQLLKSGVTLAIATDFNPGSCMCYHLPMMASLASIKYGLSPYQVLQAITWGGAKALGRDGDIGSLEKGKRADLALFHIPDYRHLVYHLCGVKAAAVVTGGRLIKSDDFCPEQHQEVDLVKVYI